MLFLKTHSVKASDLVRKTNQNLGLSLQHNVIQDPSNEVLQYLRFLRIKVLRRHLLAISCKNWKNNNDFILLTGIFDYCFSSVGCNSQLGVIPNFPYPFILPFAFFYRVFFCFPKIILLLILLFSATGHPHSML